MRRRRRRRRTSGSRVRVVLAAQRRITARFAATSMLSLSSDLSFVAPLADGGVNRVTAATVAPSGRRLALATGDRVVTLYDDTGAKRDKFATKPATETVRWAAWWRAAALHRLLPRVGVGQRIVRVVARQRRSAST